MLRRITIAILTLGLVTTPVQADQQRQCLAKAIYHEARGESIQGQKAVGYVVLNRLNSPKWPKTICDVVHQKGQFSGIGRATIPENKKIKYNELASKLITSYNVSNDPTNGARYFHNRFVKPGWKAIKTAVIGAHYFYR